MYTKEQVTKVVTDYVSDHPIVRDDYSESKVIHLTDTRLETIAELLDAEFNIECISNTYSDYIASYATYFDRTTDSILFFYWIEPEIEFEDIEDVVEMFMNIQNKLEDVKKHIK